MALEQVNDYTINDIENIQVTQGTQRKAKVNIDFTFSGSEPTEIKAGSVFDINGTLYEVSGTNLSISGSVTASTDNYILVDGVAGTATWSTTVPTFDVAKGGYYNGNDYFLPYVYNDADTFFLIEGRRVLFQDVVTIQSNSVVKGTGTGDANISFLGFYESDGTTRQGYVGLGSSGNDDVFVNADTGDVRLNGNNIRISGNTIPGSAGGWDVGVDTRYVHGSTTRQAVYNRLTATALPTSAIGRDIIVSGGFRGAGGIGELVASRAERVSATRVTVYAYDTQGSTATLFNFDSTDATSINISLAW